MKRFTQSASYARLRAVTGVLFIALGLAIVVRTVAILGFDLRGIGPLVMGAALVALGAFRLRDYAAVRRNGS
jgi:hypothetical protein